jgi:hypothetical protein
MPLADMRHRPVAIDVQMQLRFHYEVITRRGATTCPFLPAPGTHDIPPPTNNLVDSRTHDAVDRRCDVCRRAIKSGDGRYRVGDNEYHPDCFRFWLTTPSRREDEAPD